MHNSHRKTINAISLPDFSFKIRTTTCLFLLLKKNYPFTRSSSRLRGNTKYTKYRETLYPYPHQCIPLISPHILGNKTPLVNPAPECLKFCLNPHSPLWKPKKGVIFFINIQGLALKSCKLELITRNTSPSYVTKFSRMNQVKFVEDSQNSKQTISLQIF